MIEFLSACQQTITSILVKAAGSAGAESLNANQVKQVMRCALHVVRLAKTVVVSSEGMVSIWRPEAVSSLLAQFEQNPKFKKPSAVTSMCKELLSTISSGTSKLAEAERINNANALPVGTAASPATNGNAKIREIKAKKNSKRKADGLEANTSGVTPIPKKRKKSNIT